MQSKFGRQDTHPGDSQLLVQACQDTLKTCVMSFVDFCIWLREAHVVFTILHSSMEICKFELCSNNIVKMKPKWGFASDYFDAQVKHCTLRTLLWV